MRIAGQHSDLLAIHIYSFAEMPKNSMKKNRLIIFLKAHLQQKHIDNYTVLFWVSQQIVITDSKINIICLARFLQHNR